MTSPSSSFELSTLDFNEHPSDSTQAAAGYYICCGTDLIVWLRYCAEIPGISVTALISCMFQNYENYFFLRVKDDFF